MQAHKLRQFDYSTSIQSIQGLFKKRALRPATERPNFAYSSISGQSKAVHQLLQAGRLGGQLLAGRRALLGGGAVGLHNGGNLIHTLGHLGNGGGLALHGLHHNVHLRGHVARVIAGPLQGLGDLAHRFAALGHGVD